MKDSQSSMVAKAVEKAPVSIVITDAKADDNPITFVNEAFQKITLYSREFALGRNCRFMQGEATETDAIEDIRQGLARGEEFQVTLTNYKADGTPFRNQLLVAPVHDDDGEISAFFGVQRELGEDASPDGNAEALDLLRELQHRVKNHLSMVVSMIRIQASRRVTPDSLQAVSRRIEALGLLYEELFATSSGASAGETIRTGAYLSRIASTIAGLEGRNAIRVNIECEEIDLPVDRAARLGLLLSELLTNAFEHAFEGRDSGLVRVRFEKLAGGAVRLSVEDDGIGLPKGSNWPFEALSVERQRARAEREEGELDTTGDKQHSGVGGSIVIALTKTLGAAFDVNRPLRGTIVTVDFETRA